MTAVLRFLFTLATAALVLGGAVIIAAQVVALVLGRGHLLEQVPEVVGPPTLIAASLAGLLAFVLSYHPRPGAGEQVHGSREVDGASHPA